VRQPGRRTRPPLPPGGHAGPERRSVSGRRRGRFVTRYRGSWLLSWRSMEVSPYCMLRLLLCPFGTHFGLVFSGRPAGRPVYAPLRERAAPPPGDLPGTRPAPRRSAFRAPRAWLGSSAPSPRPPWRWPPSLRYASARRRRRGLPGSRPAPRRSACRARGPGSDPWSPSPRSPRVRSSSPRHGCARRRRRARARRPARGPTTSLPGPGGPGSHSRRLPPFSTPLFALAAGWAAAMPSRLTCDHCKGGGRVLLPPGHAR
jgi:hypothetical protein